MQPNLTPSQLFMEGLEQHCAEVAAEVEDPMLAEFLRELCDCLGTADWTRESEERFADLFGRLAKLVWAGVASAQTGVSEVPYEISEILMPHREHSEP
ncbi:hypothetical protein PPSIR1_21129 [Plesiocystis pacifica SIR-1]|uniref:Uncharacterized protein n=1 Tax=Plesiocystis pacifica SIR-1 TaxID=391625 RepID=A6G3G5_9BACT|nr:hypothetical protein [Plesiocystis pacifica]EDM79572.1 hypothetical protein PPSIR1_21129 [Plesiocystis pacifica SIR-1]